MDKHALDGHKSTEGMVDYDRNSSAQQAMVVSQEDRLRALVERIGAVEGDLRLVDYGCGPGSSAIGAVRPSIDAYLSAQPSGAVSVCHADQPGNDWNALFALVEGPSGYRDLGPAVRTEAAVGSFYDQMVADGSVHLGTCFAACHWLSTALRLNAPGSVWFADLAGQAREQMRQLARDDWAGFLRRRSTELAPGGFLFVSTLGAVPDRSEINGSAASGRGIYRALQVVAQTMVDDGLLDGQVLDGFVFSLWFMTEEEAREPIAEDEVLRDAFDVQALEVAPTSHNPHDFFADLLDDPDAYATAYAGYIRAFADSTLRTQLFGPSSTGREELNELADEFYRRLHELYRTRREHYAFELWHLTVVLRRR